MVRKIAICLLCVVVLLGGTVTVSAVNDNSEEPSSEPKIADGYTVAAQNRSYKLYANMKTGDFAVYDISGQHLWQSGQWDVMDENSQSSKLNSGRIKTDLLSVIAIDYIQVSTIASTAVPSYQNSYAYSVMRGNTRVTEIKNGIRTEYYFDDIDSTIPVEIMLNDSGITARIVGEDLKIGKEYRITSISLLPGFMAAENDEAGGYLFVPSGSGGIIPLGSRKGDIAAYSEMVYGRDTAIELEEYPGETENILVPVYGIKHGDSAVTAIITSGDTSATVSAGADSSTTSFSYVYSEYITSIIDSTTLFESNFENQRIIYGAEERDKFENYSVDYVFLSGEDADYSGMARVYRERLKLSKNSEKPALALTLYGAATKKASFLGIPYMKSISLTSFGEAEKIINDFNDNGVPVALKYVGWNNNGIENKKVPAKFSPVSVLGGKKAFNNLYNMLIESENSFYFDLNFNTFSKSGRGFSAYSDVCRSIFNTRTPIYKYMRSVYVPVNTENPSWLLKPDEVSKAAEKFFKNYDFEGGISFDNIGEKLYSDFSKNGTARNETVKIFTDIVKKASKKHNISVNGGNSYLFEYVDRVYELPTSNDGNLLFSQSVPFVQMVLHGSVSYSASKSDTLLDCLEFGADPSFIGIYADDSTLIETSFNWLYGTAYSSWHDDAISVYKKYAKIYGDLYNREIVRHRAENGVSVTEFDNGVKVYVNRNEKDYIIDSITVPAKGYKAVGGAS